MPRAPDNSGFDALVCSVPVHLTLLFQTGDLSMPEKPAATTEVISGVSILQLLEVTTSLEKLKRCFDCLEAICFAKISKQLFTSCKIIMPEVFF